MNKTTGWIIFAIGALIALACFGLAAFFFVASFFGEGEAEAAAQAMALVVGLVGIPFYFVARYGWRVARKAPVVPGVTGVSSQVARVYDPAEGIVQIIETTDDKALFFTRKRLVVAHVEGLSQSGGYGTDALSVLSALVDLGRSMGAAKTMKQLGKLPPEEILVANRLNFAVPYSEVTKVELFRKFLQRKIRVTAGQDTRIPAEQAPASQDICQCPSSSAHGQTRSLVADCRFMVRAGG